MFPAYASVRILRIQSQIMTFLQQFIAGETFKVASDSAGRQRILTTLTWKKIVKITSDEFNGRLINFRANRSQFSTARPVFLREWLLAHQFKTVSLYRSCILIADLITD